MSALYIVLYLSFAVGTQAFAKVRVVATLPDLGAVARQLGGERVEVKTLALATEDPHFVDPRPSYLVSLSRAELLILNGMELEEAWLAPLILNSRNAKISLGSTGYLDASIALTRRLEVPNGAVDRSMGDVHGSGNPHYTYDPRVMILVAAQISDRLIALDPDGAKYYQSRLTEWRGALNTYMRDVERRFRELSSREIVVYHRSWSYFNDWLKLKVVGEIEPKPGVPPHPRHVASLTSVIKSSEARVLLQESYYPRRASKVIAQITDAQLLTPVAQAQDRQEERYLTRLKRVIEPLYNALNTAKSGSGGSK